MTYETVWAKEPSYLQYSFTGGDNAKALFEKTRIRKDLDKKKTQKQKRQKIQKKRKSECLDVWKSWLNLVRSCWCATQQCPTGPSCQEVSCAPGCGGGCLLGRSLAARGSCAPLAFTRPGREWASTRGGQWEDPRETTLILSPFLLFVSKVQRRMLLTVS